MIPLLPKEIDIKLETLFSKSDQALPFFTESQSLYFTENGKAGISTVLEGLNLERKDEVFISTTSDSIFVSSCVTSTLFNWSKVSRVLTDKTKLVFVIHEFGFENPELDVLLQESKRKGIPLVEDCAHFISDSTNGIGKKGDFAIHSLPKIFPVRKGGILTINKSNYEFDKDIIRKYSFEELDSFLIKYLPYLDEINQTRRDIYRLYSENIEAKEVFHFKGNDVPFVYAFILEEGNILRNKLDEYVELGRNYVPKNILVPTNPFIHKSEHLKIISLINKYK